MPFDLPPGLLDNLGTIGLGLLLVYMIATGKLVTAREHSTVIHDRDEWRTESRIKDQQIAEQAVQLRELSEVGHTLQAVLNAIQRGPTQP